MSQLILFVLGVVGGLALIAVSVAVPGNLLARPDDAGDAGDATDASDAGDAGDSDDGTASAANDAGHGHHQDGPHA